MKASKTTAANTYCLVLLDNMLNPLNIVSHLYLVFTITQKSRFNYYSYFTKEDFMAY